MARVLSRLPKQTSERLLVGLETSDDAGVFLLDDERALVQTLDFFTPIVDDPYDFGQIAAANSLSDIYAMGGVPLTALNIVCFPTREGDPEVLVEILRGGADKVAESGAVLAGGHTVNDDEIKFGLSVTGLVHPARITPNGGGRAGDWLVLTKPLGTGLVTTALKQGVAEDAHVAEATRCMKGLNDGASRAATQCGITGATDITGFGLMGHLYEMACASCLEARLDVSALPTLPGALDYARAGVGTAGGRANQEFLDGHFKLDPELPDELRALIFDPQTSGGLLLAVPEARLTNLLSALASERTPAAAVVGRLESGTPGFIHTGYQGRPAW